MFSSDRSSIWEQNNTNAPLEILNYLTKIKSNPDEILRYHQLLISKYFTEFPHARGLLIYHEVGSGKTLIASSLAVHFSQQGLKVIILAPKSLQNNFKQGVNQYIKAQGDMSSKKLSDIDKFKYVSLNANNLLDQLQQIDQTKETKKFEKSLGDLSEFIHTGNAFNDCLLIIDEAHNLSNGIANGSKNAVGLYDMILKARNLKLLLLTGTPIVNEAFELGILFNMVKGYVYDGTIRGTLFPEIRTEFERYFVDYKTMRIKNVEMFINRCYGLCSHYGLLYTKNLRSKDLQGKNKIKYRSVQREGYPTEYELKVEIVCMSGEQFSRYDSARDKEKEESIRSSPDEHDRFSKKSGSTTYRVASRQISNYVIPMYALGEARGKKAREKHIDKIKDTDLQNLKVYSPKFKKILENIHRHDGIAVVYSDFVTGEGINVFARVLGVCGYNEWKVSDLDDTKWISKKNAKYTVDGSAKDYSELDKSTALEWEGMDDLENKHGDIYFKSEELRSKQSNESRSDVSDFTQSFNDTQYGGYVDNLVFDGGKIKRYAKLTGELEVEDRSKLLEYFNNPKNKYGDIIKILLISGAGSEGISIANARSIHLMHPYWNMAKIDQVKARAIRYKSHDALALKERTVQPYIYISTYPSGYKEVWRKKQQERVAHGQKREKLEKTTDVELYEKSLHQKRLNDYFLAAIIRGSIDCAIHVKSLSLEQQQRINCVICNPTDNQLYHPIINTQIKLDNPCLKYEKGKVKAKEIKVDLDGTEETYYYTDDPDHGIIVFLYNENLNGYVQMTNDHPAYHKLHEILEKKL